MKNKLKSINNIPFLVCLATLLLNDFYLKTEYHNWLTGKLSDFCGLFVFASFWTALFPNQKRIVCISTALFFVIWKSPHSQPFIDFFSQNFYSVHRVVDITDLMALLILPPAYFYKPEQPIQLKLHPIPVALLAIVSFCATSTLKPTQVFGQPQYLLFKAGIIDIKNIGYRGEYKVYELDSIIIISIKEIQIDKRASLDDEFHKTQILKDIDLRLLRELKIKEGYYIRELSNYKALKNSLIVAGQTTITLKLDSITDKLNFKNTRLDGNFQRFSSDNQLLIEGKYKDGIEDSTWTFYNHKNEVVSRKYFQNGELTKTEVFKNGNLLSEQKYNTRNETVRNKYFHIAIVFLLIIALITKLFLNFKNSAQKDIILLSDFSRIASIIGLPLVVLILAKLFSFLIPNSYSTVFLGIFGEVILVYIAAVPLLIIIFYFLKLRNKFDLICYVVVFALTTVLLEELLYLRALIN